MAAHLTKVVIFDERLYVRGGMVDRWMVGMTRDFKRHAVTRAPSRTGELRRGISATTHRRGVKRIEGSIGSSAPHTMYVLRGTGWPVRGHSGRIWSRGGWRALGQETFAGRGRPGAGAGEYMHLSPGGPITREVRGQEPNNFLEAAWRATARNHTSIRGVGFPLSF